MNFSKFVQQLAAVREHADWLRHQASTNAPVQSGWLAEAIGELSDAVAELQQTEQSLRREMDDLHRSRAAVDIERQRYRSLFEFAPDGYLVTRLDGTIDEANWAAGILLNTPEDALVGRSLATYVVPDEAQAFQSKLAGLDQVDGAREWETCLQPRDYSPFYASVTVAPERREGALVALRWLVRDITPRKQAVEQVQALNAALEQRVEERTAQLQAANRQLQAEIEDRKRADQAVRARAQQQAVVAGLGQKALSGTDLMTLMQLSVTQVAQTLQVEFCQLLELLPDGQTLRVCASYGWPAHGEPGEVLAPGDDPQAEYTLRVRAPVLSGSMADEPRFALAAMCAAHGVTSGLSVAVPARAGYAWGVLAAHTRHAQAFGADDASFLVAVANVLSATLERQRAEAEIRTLNAGLEQRVAERTMELESKNRELETFTYSVSHDLKAPLRGIDGYSRLLLESYSGQLDAEGEDSLRTIRRAVQQMNQLIDDLLAYARLERRSLVPGRVDVAELLEEVIAERWDELQRRGLALTVEMPCQVVSADRDGLTQALRNLLDNALKFTQAQAQPRIEIGGREEGHWCRLWVRDNGIGFDMRYADRIFGLFQRLHRTEDYDGTGIGLAIVAKAMQRMQGRAWAESTPGAGACFYLDIPK